MKISEAMKKGLVVANKNGVKQGKISSIVNRGVTECCVLGLIPLGKLGYKRVKNMSESDNLFGSSKFYKWIYKNFPTIDNGNVGEIYSLNDTEELSFERCIQRVEEYEAVGKF